ncbi:phage virion morphogenesis protein [Caballeronia sp. LZ001]|uniref:phage virion morphogenesis protein n=1 Tax=Caballeronia sp. LZ001 TaxID=3038553 RepID=UPI0028568B0C|nr:phage virion morphogenesis protein [Caballeronia sp. LZ001]MDR5803411.1 phage virion morphogenesis protein [Caballeronia sp. LZ001]
MSEIQIDSAEWDAALARLYAFMRDSSAVMSVVAALMNDAVEENFAMQGRPRWLGLSPKTLKRRGQSAADSKILQYSGRLAASIQQRHDATSATVGTNLVYAAIHQFGGTIARHPMSGMVRLRTERNGMLKRQPSDTRLAVFAKRRYKQVKIVRWTRTQGWTVKMPARPFLSLPEGDNARIEREVTDYLRRLISG